MPYTGNPASSQPDAIRFWLGDTSTSPLLTDNEINYLISVEDDSTNGDAKLLAAAACTVIMAKYAGEVSISADGVTISADQLQQKYSQLRSSLIEQAAQNFAASAEPYAGGVTQGEMPDPSTVPGWAGIGRFDNPMAGSQVYGGPLDGTQSDADDGVLGS